MSGDKPFKPVTHVIFDMDGLLLDTEDLYTEATQAVVGPFGKVYSWALKLKVMGHKAVDSTRMIISELDLPLSPDEFVEQFHHSCLQVFPNAQVKPDTETLYTEATQAIVGPHGKVFTWDVKVKMMGQTTIDGTNLLISELDLPLSPEEYIEQFHQTCLTLFPTAKVLPDTERLYTEATQAVVEPFGKKYEWDLKVRLMGRKSIDSQEAIITELNLPLSHEEYVQHFREQCETVFPTSQLLPDSVQLYINVNIELLAEFGKTYTWNDSAVVQGHTAVESAEIIVNRFNLPISVDEYLTRSRKKFETTLPNANFLPGVKRLVKHLHSKGVPMAIATSSAKSSFDLKMTNHQEFIQFFDPIVMGSSDEEVKKGKPSPDIFLVAAKRFKDTPEPEKCLVFEDAPNGVQAAVAAGMQVVMIPDPRTDPELREGATVVLESMEQFKPEDFGLPAYDDKDVEADA